MRLDITPASHSEEIFNFGLNALRKRLTQRERIAHLEYGDHQGLMHAWEGLLPGRVFVAGIDGHDRVSAHGIHGVNHPTELKHFGKIVPNQSSLAGIR